MKNYIIENLTKNEVDYEIQSTLSARTLTENNFVVGEVKNILIRIPGYGKEHKAILISSHYDSIAGSYGANNNGAAVATLLKYNRIIEEKKIRNDIFFVFSDAEESGLLGMEAFGKHSWFDDIEIALSLDARGNIGHLY